MKTMKITTFEETYGHPLTIGELVKGFKENTTTGEVTSMIWKYESSSGKSVPGSRQEAEVSRTGWRLPVVSSALRL